jgi:hypothetical protein
LADLDATATMSRVNFSEKIRDALEGEIVSRMPAVLRKELNASLRACEQAAQAGPGRRLRPGETR